MKILVIDDEQTMQHLLRLMLEGAGYEVLSAASGEEGIRKIREEKVGFVILDVLMGGMDGFTACAEIRRFTPVPILMLTAIAGSEADKVKGLRAGADDYMVKPFSKQELLARIEAILRRTHTASVRVDNEWTNGTLELNETMRTVTVAGKKVTLTRREFDLLAFLLKHREQVFSREQLMEKLWGEQAYNVTTRTVDTHIKTLRIKLGEAGVAIETVWGLGYKLVKL
ncbi:response regulator transcription factor [Planococcus sp. ISL-110]|uniref:response regulator transcription factor n=1 Tax=Planococcus sp. ISL-110 TaxID=2819167 RepID=UPI001BE98B76|nr:response regulator transcription factor [Planococcus sp. ISL-110]MBT2569801.1 response regulator transcription factor [Planococcus sp. ISL-110]